jgi:hypothetical protein
MSMYRLCVIYVPPPDHVYPLEEDICTSVSFRVCLSENILCHLGIVNLVWKAGDTKGIVGRSLQLR